MDVPLIDLLSDGESEQPAAPPPAPVKIPFGFQPVRRPTPGPAAVDALRPMVASHGWGRLHQPWLALGQGSGFKSSSPETWPSSSDSSD